LKVSRIDLTENALTLPSSSIRQKAVAGLRRLARIARESIRH
jgi:hypothetical protein